MRGEKIKNVFSAVVKYLSDWRNWLIHGLVGAGLLVAVIWVPIAWWIKLIVLASVITLNSVRMVLSSKKNKNKQEIKDQVSQPDQAKNTTSATSSQVEIINQKTEN